MLDTVKKWLAEFVGDTPLWVDYLDSSAPGVGLYPKGVQVISHSRDILGNARQRLRCRFTVRFTAPGLQDKTQAAQSLLTFEKWIAESRSAPQLGEDTRWYTENGRLEKVTRVAAAVYAVELIAEYWNMEEKHEN